jgi:hypothetical protein
MRSIEGADEEQAPSLLYAEGHFLKRHLPGGIFRTPKFVRTVLRSRLNNMSLMSIGKGATESIVRGLSSGPSTPVVRSKLWTDCVVTLRAMIRLSVTCNVRQTKLAPFSALAWKISPTAILRRASSRCAIAAAALSF